MRARRHINPANITTQWDPGEGFWLSSQYYFIGTRSSSTVQLWVRVAARQYSYAHVHTCIIDFCASWRFASHRVLIAKVKFLIGKKWYSHACKQVRVCLWPKYVSIHEAQSVALAVLASLAAMMP